jgi:AraC-binding-like domain
VPLTAMPLGDRETFTGRVENHRYGALQVTTVTAGEQRVRRTPSLIARTAGEYLIASIPLNGTGVVEQDGRSAVLEPYSIIFYDSTRPYTLTFRPMSSAASSGRVTAATSRFMTRPSAGSAP